MTKYVMECPNCGDQHPAHKMQKGDFMCHNCYSVFEEGDATVINLTEVERHRQSFVGAKIAGAIPEKKEFEGDREQMRQERW